MPNNNKEMLDESERCRAAVEEKLGGFFTAEVAGSPKLIESMRYSLLAGGKRIRPILCIKFCEAAGGKLDDAIDAACAIEMLHTYSLIHDDLPCMDNSDMRRGKPSNHKKFGEFTATLAGDALQAAAFETLTNSNVPADAIVEMTRMLAQSAGPYGICGGQHLDVHSISNPLSKAGLTEIHNLKTAALIAASAKIGVAAGGGSHEQLKAAEEYALAVGFAFQVRDDVLDVISTTTELGKPMGADIENNKQTFAMILGVDKCEEMILAETQKAIAALEGKFERTEFLAWFAQLLAERKK